MILLKMFYDLVTCKTKQTSCKTLKKMFALFNVTTSYKLEYVTRFTRSCDASKR